MIKRLVLCLALLCGMAAAQGGLYPSPSVYFPVASATQAVSVSVVANPANFKQLPFPSYSAGSIMPNFLGTTGAPSGCVITIYFTESNTPQTNLVLVPASAAVGPLTTNTVARVTVPAVYSQTPALGPFGVVTYSYTCTTYPTAGTFQLEFVPDPQPVFQYAHIASNSTFALRQSAGQLHTVTINTPGTTEVLTVYDNSACTGQVIATITTPAVAGVTLTYDVATTIGLCIQTTGTTAGDYTVSYR
jgi:hypothetical protein